MLFDRVTEDFGKRTYRGEETGGASGASSGGGGAEHGGGYENGFRCLFDEVEMDVRFNCSGGLCCFNCLVGTGSCLSYLK